MLITPINLWPTAHHWFTVKQIPIPIKNNFKKWSLSIYAIFVGWLASFSVNAQVEIYSKLRADSTEIQVAPVASEKAESLDTFGVFWRIGRWTLPDIYDLAGC